MSNIKKEDTLGDRVKGFETLFAKSSLDEDQPICVRIDGKAFHTYTKGLARPFDQRLSQAMIDTMKFLIEKTDARLGYTQSDEISLVFFKTALKQQGMFAGREQKLTSVLASMATAKFNAEVMKNIPEKSDILAFFDCRIWNVPTLTDAAEVFVWRQEDAIKNAISMAASSEYSTKQLHGKKSREKIEMLKDKGIEWSDYPEFFKSGTFAKKENVMLDLEDGTQCMRTKIETFHLPRLRSKLDFEDILFSPIFKQYQEKNEFNKALSELNNQKFDKTKKLSL